MSLKESSKPAGVHPVRRNFSRPGTSVVCLAAGDTPAVRVRSSAHHAPSWKKQNGDHPGAIAAKSVRRADRTAREAQLATAGCGLAGTPFSTSATRSFTLKGFERQATRFGKRIESFSNW